MRIGILGGTFDPPHHGHLLAAGDAFEALELDRLVFMPTAAQPLKAGREAASTSDRFEMVKLLVGDDSRFEVSEVETARGGLSYTVDTLRTLTAEWPGANLFWLVGADVPKSFAKWREPDRIVQLATVVVLQRTDETPDLSLMPGTPRFIRTRRIDISSTEIRERVQAGKSIRGFVPESVAAYIAAHRLYR